MKKSKEIFEIMKNFKSVRIERILKQFNTFTEFTKDVEFFDVALNNLYSLTTKKEVKCCVIKNIDTYKIEFNVEEDYIRKYIRLENKKEVIYIHLISNN